MMRIRHLGRTLLGRPGLRLATPIGAVAVIAILLFGSGAAAACPSPPPSSPPYTVLDTIPLVDAIAANSTMVFAQGVANCSHIWAITPSDHVSLYAKVPVRNGACDEGALTLAPNTTFVGHSSGGGGGGLPGSPLVPAVQGVAQWGHGGHGGCNCTSSPTNTTLFDVVAGRLFAITEGGKNVTLVAKFPISHKPSENMGLAWDQVGQFGHDLIVTSSAGGKVWLVNATGNVTLLVALHTYIGGPAVAPMSFGPFGGDIVLAEKSRGSIVAISPTGNVSFVANWSKANAVTFPSVVGGHHGHGGGGWGGYGVAEWGGHHHHGHGGGCGDLCSFGPQHFVLFVANYSSGAVEAFPASDLRGYAGDGFVAGGLNQGIGAFSSDGSTSYFATQTQRLSDIASVYCPPPPTCGGPSGSGWGDASN